MGKLIDLSGQKFGRLAVICRGANHTTSGGQIKSRWYCECDCGEAKFVRGGHLRSGATTSCGCLQREKILEAKTKHGMCRFPIYGSWQMMKDRCSNPSNECYGNYGGRGISYDPKWETFEGFYEDVGDRPEGMTLDRIDNDGNYCKENCRWATATQQAINRRLPSTNTSGYRGVSWSKACCKWVAKIRVNGKDKSLGYFFCLIKAAKAYDRAALELRGLDAVPHLNFPPRL